MTDSNNEIRPWQSIRRGVWVGLPLVALCSSYVAYSEIRLGAELVNSSLLVPSVFLLLVLSLGNRWVGRRRPGLALDRRELLTSYILLIVSLGIGGKGMIEMLLPTLAAGRYYAVRRGWTELADALPRWWRPRDESLQGFFGGQQSLNWHGWLVPFVTWGLFLLVLLLTTLCICILLRRQWVERERLVFPMTMLPLELTRPQGGLLTSPAMWLAFGLVFAIESLNSLHQWFPTVPHIPIKSSPELDISGGFTTLPWSAVKGWTVSFYPFAIGLAFLLTTEVSFSCWFFYLLVTKGEVVASEAYGLHSPGSPGALSRFPYVGERGAGAYFGFALLVLWIARRPMLHALQGVLRARSLRRERAAIQGQNGDPEDPDSRDDESDGHRPDSDHDRWEWIAAVGLVIGVAALVAFCLFGGTQLRIALLFWAITFAMIITMTRARVEGGTVWALGPDTAASLEVLRVTGTAAVPIPSLMMLAVMQFFTNDWRALVMPNQLESLKIADSANIPVRRIIGPIVLATILGITVAFWASLAVWYRYGCATGNVDNWALIWGRVPWSFGRSWMKNPVPTDVPGLYAVGFGALVVFGLAALRSQLLWWPLHPIGYVLGSSGDLDQVWFCFFLGWFIKTAALRYGGRRLFSRLLPFFLGLILGDYTAAAAWSLVGMVFNVPVYKVFP